MKHAGAMDTAPAVARAQTLPRWARAGFELLLILALWVFYSLARLLADTSLRPALNRANDLLYVVTAGVLIWLWRLGADRYGPARRALVIGTLLGLVVYLLMPTAPPRFISGYVDVLSLHAADGWWGADASAPRGLGGRTNELAAFPSMHAGWALWVALALQVYATRKWVRVLGWLYALGTAIVIVGTGNHWVIDALMGWLVILLGWAFAVALGRVPIDLLWRRRTLDERPSREDATVVD